MIRVLVELLLVDYCDVLLPDTAAKGGNSSPSSLFLSDQDSWVLLFLLLVGIVVVGSVSS